MNSIWNTIYDHISTVTGTPFSGHNRSNVGGGCINTACVIQDPDRAYFVKLNDADRLDMFTAESAGLEEIAATATIRVPQPVCCGVVESTAYIVMEYIASAHNRSNSYKTFGQQLAKLHRFNHQYFGWRLDNTRFYSTDKHLVRQLDQFLA